MSLAPIAAGTTIVSTFKKSFTEVHIDAERENAVPTVDFLDAAEALTTMFGRSNIQNDKLASY